MSGQREIDVLVVGSGAAGMLAAVTAAETGQRTVLLTKGQAARSGATATIIGGCSVDGRTCVDLLGLNGGYFSDTSEALFEDTVAGGKYLNHRGITEAMVNDIGPISCSGCVRPACISATPGKARAIVLLAG